MTHWAKPGAKCVYIADISEGVRSYGLARGIVFPNRNAVCTMTHVKVDGGKLGCRVAEFQHSHPFAETTMHYRVCDFRPLKSTSTQVEALKAIARDPGKLAPADVEGVEA